MARRPASVKRVRRRAVLILWSWTAILSGVVLWPVYSDMSTGWLPFALAAMAVALYTVLHPEVRAAKRGNGGDQLELDLTDQGSSR